MFVCLLFIVNWLLFVWRLLFAVGCCSLYCFVYCSLFVVCCLLSVANCLLLDVRRPWFAVCRLLFVVC